MICSDVVVGGVAVVDIEGIVDSVVVSSVDVGIGGLVTVRSVSVSVDIVAVGGVVLFV
ncbi:hypothetical protein DPMN_123190 [Dreissena polymorpha]|uniref:Uncharacterized protein n=1 Tax=Dreissena polymorpha TaxID=45954 RepID=A0A9D4GTZ4_DREPO|nr:hypothetical protein DPMN_123190 [Dreissena polymorpha]